MRIGFVTDPLDSLKIKKDSTYAMMVEAVQRGHDLYVMQQEDLVWKRDRVFAAMCRIAINKGSPDSHDLFRNCYIRG